MRSEWIRFLRCPDCYEKNLRFRENDELICEQCQCRFPIAHGRPVLLRHDNKVFPIDSYINISQEIPLKSRYRINRILPTPSVNLSSRRVLAMLRDRLKLKKEAAVLVVGGGAQRFWLDTELGADHSRIVVYSDIDICTDVDFYCDGHEIPFQDESVDAVVTTAVLEHVLYPERVAGEIVRVLKKGGLLYSELPFIQQVHEGAYDFTRYSLSGHRRLFNRIKEIECGMVAGPGTALAWSIESYLLSFVSRKLTQRSVKAISRMLFSWIKYTDYILANRPQAMDGASCTYLFGEKIDGQLADEEVIKSYIGAKHLRHI